MGVVEMSEMDKYIADMTGYIYDISDHKVEAIKVKPKDLKKYRYYYWETNVDDCAIEILDKYADEIYAFVNGDILHAVAVKWRVDDEDRWSLLERCADFEYLDDNDIWFVYLVV